MAEEMKSLRDDLIAAKKLIDAPENWGKGEIRNCPCASDALEDVASNVSHFRDLTRALFVALPEHFEPDGNDCNHPVAQFNDHPDTTHADIMALFDRAIAASGEKG